MTIHSDIRPAPAAKATLQVWRGESLLSRLIRQVILPLMGSKRVLRDIARHARQLRRQRLKGEAKPTRRVVRDCNITAREIAGSNVLFVEPKDGAVTRTIIYIHGGAYVANMMIHQWNLVEGLAMQNRARVVVPHYPLAPENDWQPAFAMMRTLYESLVAEVGAENIVLTGDSAGAGLALSLAQLLRDEGQPLPSKMVLYSPWLDLREDNPEQDACDAADPMLARPVLVWSAKRWAGETALDDPRISPVFGDIRDLPPMLVFSGTADLLHPDSLALFAKAQADGCDLKLIIGERMTHAWSVLETSEARRLHRETAAFLR